ETRRAANAFVKESDRAAAGLAEQMAAATVGSDQGCLRGCQGDIIISPGEQPVDAQGTSQSDRDLNGADEVFDVFLEAFLACLRLRVVQCALALRRRGREVPAVLDRFLAHPRPAWHLRRDILGVRTQLGEQLLPAAGAQETFEMATRVTTVGGHEMTPSVRG